MYYTSDNFVQQNILASNLGLIAKYDDRNALFVSVVDLKTGKAKDAKGVEDSLKEQFNKLEQRVEQTDLSRSSVK